MNDAFQGPVPDEEIAPQELTWPLRHISLSGLFWQSPGKIAVRADRKETFENTSTRPVLMVHGWLDNALSFARLAPQLAFYRDVYALDLAGHGQSGHRPAGQGYPLTEYVADLAELVATYFDSDRAPDGVDLVGHSLGGIVALFYAAAFPEKVGKLVMIDSLGPLTREPSEVVPQMRKAIKKRLSGSGDAVIYDSIEQAAKAREGGMIPLSHEAAMTLIPRNLKRVEAGFKWSTDSQLRHPSMMMFDEAQVRGCLAEVKTPVRLIRAEHGLIVSRPELKARAEAIRELETVSVPGGHHCHLDGDVGPVITAVRDFLDDV